MKIIEYDHYIHCISDGNNIGYMAVIPAFKNSVVFGDTREELDEGIIFTIETAIEDLKKQGKSIPRPEHTQRVSGKFVVRIDPTLHEKLILEAKTEKKSLNRYIEEKLRQ